METDKFRLQFITQSTSKDDIIAEVSAFLSGGGRWVQLRMKDAARDEIAETAREVLSLCRSYGAVFILNDDPELAAEIGCDGVHLGKNDTHPVQARAYIGDRAIIGATANTAEDIAELCNQPIDYIGLGPFRHTSTKRNLAPLLGFEGYENIFKNEISIPVVVIGGITAEDIAPLKECGAQNFAISSAISNSTNPKETTEKIINKIWTI